MTSRRFVAESAETSPRIEHTCGDPGAVAVAHSLVVVIYHMLERGSEYAELGSDYFERRRPAATAQRLARQIEQLGYKVTLEAAPGTE